MDEILLGAFLLTALVLVLALLVIGARSILVPSRPATVTVNGATDILTTTGKKLLTALSDNGVLIPSACAGAGTCGLCRVTVEQGAGDALPTESSKLSRAELAEGMRLACQVVLRSDVAVTVPEDLLGAESFVANVADARFLTPFIREVVIQLPEGRRPDIVAGAFVQISAPPFGLDFATVDVPAAYEAAWNPVRALRALSDIEVTRAYSISNRPEDTAAGRVVLNIRLALPPPSVPDALPGVVSSWLFGVNPGDPIALSGPFGTFRARGGTAEMVLIGGGVGMAPLRAIVLDQLERQRTGRKITFWYGARSRAELLYEEEFEALAAHNENFDWTVALSDPKPNDEWTGPTGFIHRVVLEQYLKDHAAPEACEYYLCGPPLMVRAVLAMLDDLGVDDDQIFLDDFGV